MTVYTQKTKLRFTAVSAAILLLFGSALSANAQRDPFELPSWKKPKTQTGGDGKSSKPAAPAVTPVPVAPVESRIAYFKRQREEAANSGRTLPKVTSVMTLDELAVTGIFKTPRGYAAMVEAKPIKLSYAVYPGDRFFDGQLVAIEENRLIFRKVTKMSNGKFVTSVETMPLRRYSQDQEVQGTAPKDSETAQSSGSKPAEAVFTGSLVSPLDEMNRGKSNGGAGQAPSAKGSRKPVKVAGVRR
jgi:hypothetical protein